MILRWRAIEHNDGIISDNGSILLAAKTGAIVAKLCLQLGQN